MIEHHVCTSFKLGQIRTMIQRMKGTFRRWLRSKQTVLKSSERFNTKLTRLSHFGLIPWITSGMLVTTFLCVFSLIAIRGLSPTHCDACGKGIPCNYHSSIENAQPADCGDRDDLIHESYANITYNFTSSTLPDLPEHNWNIVSSLEVNYLNDFFEGFFEYMFQNTTASFTHW